MIAALAGTVSRPDRRRDHRGRQRRRLRGDAAADRGAGARAVGGRPGARPEDLVHRHPRQPGPDAVRLRPRRGAPVLGSCCARWRGSGRRAPPGRWCCRSTASPRRSATRTPIWWTACPASARPAPRRSSPRSGGRSAPFAALEEVPGTGAPRRPTTRSSGWPSTCWSRWASDARRRREPSRSCWTANPPPPVEDVVMEYFRQ